MKYQLVPLIFASWAVSEGINAFKMSPQDKSFGGTSKIDSSEKFSAPQKAPTADDDLPPSNEPTEKDGPKILDDYHPNRLGKSAQKAQDEQDKTEPTKEAPKVTDEQVNTIAPENDPKAGLSTGKGKASGGVGAKGESHAQVEAQAADEDRKILPDDIKVEDEAEKGLVGRLGRLMAACSMIILSELGDKTFFIAVLFAMRSPHWFVFSASFGALAIMTVLSAVLGRILPSLLSPEITTLLAAALFFVFGAKMLKEGFDMKPGEDASEEMHEVEHEIESKNNQDDMLEKGLKDQSSVSSGFGNLFSLLVSPLWVQIFVMTFLGEWGDRSQIATIAMGAGSHYWEVVTGSIIGHALCTLLAVSGGKLVATKLSLRTITFGGAACFILFGFIYTFDHFHA